MFQTLKGRSTVFVTAYDAAFARLAIKAGADGLIVGDTVGPVALGLSSVEDVTFEMLAHHSAAVRRGAGNAPVIADMPVSGSSLDACKRMIELTGADALKIEGASSEMLHLIEQVTAAGIAICGHLEGTIAPDNVLKDARRVADAGAVALVLVAMPGDLGTRITQALTIPTIGKNAGKCDGQVVNAYQALGIAGLEEPLLLAPLQAAIDAARG